MALPLAKHSLSQTGRESGQYELHLSFCSKCFIASCINRCGRIGMMMGLSVLYPQHLFAFQLLVCLEIAGCWSNHYR